MTVITKDARQSMRKYQQAAVTVLAVVASVLCLVYKHEYDRLRGVMEVMEIFGDPHGRNLTDSMSSFCKASQPPVSLPDSAARYLLDNAGSAWQAIDADLHIFSAHFVSRHEGIDEIVVLGAATAVHFRGQVDVTVFTTRGRRKITGKRAVSIGQRVQDEFKVSGTVQVLKSPTSQTDSSSSGSTWEPIIISFPIKDDSSTPRAVKFSTGSTIPVISEVNNHLYGVRTSNIPGRPIACLFLSSERGKEFPSLASSFAFYESAAEVREFWLYGQNELSFKDSGSILPAVWESGLQLGSLPWNFPFKGKLDRQKDLVLTDCALRSNGQKHHTRSTIILAQPDEFVVPRIHHTLEAILDKIPENSPPLRATFAKTVFCPNSSISVDPLEGREGVLLQTRSSNIFQFSSAESFLNHVTSGHKEMKTREVPVAIGALLVFPESCSKFEKELKSGKKTTEMSLFKFRRVVEMHEIFRHLRAFTKFL